MCFSPTQPEEHELQAPKNRAIEDQIKNDKQLLDKEITILILGSWLMLNNEEFVRSQLGWVVGPEASGKSTITRQLKLIHGGFDEKDRVAYKSVIASNVIGSIKGLINAAPIISPENQVILASYRKSWWSINWY